MPSGKVEIKIDWNYVAELLEADCSGNEVASKLGIHSNTLYQRCKKDLNVDFVTFKAEKRASGDSILKMKQFESAIKDKNIPMQIWLGKQRLGQKDKQDITTDNKPLLPPVALNITYRDETK